MFRKLILHLREQRHSYILTYLIAYLVSLARSLLLFPQQETFIRGRQIRRARNVRSLAPLCRTRDLTRDPIARRRAKSMRRAIGAARQGILERIARAMHLAYFARERCVTPSSTSLPSAVAHRPRTSGTEQAFSNYKAGLRDHDALERECCSLENAVPRALSLSNCG